MTFQHLIYGFLLALLPGAVTAQIQLPANMYADSLYAPFLHGVASGDPLSDRVLIWTKVDPQGASDSISLDWEVSPDANFSTLAASGTVQARASANWTALTDVGGLSPDTRYYYRFTGPGNQESRIGRTRTAPSGPVSHLRFAVASCSSIFSGFFNGYARIGEREDLNLVIHLGDYIYDFVDPDEEVRVPVPAPVDPTDLAGFRDRHAYYLLDPDLRLARQMHPWTVIWDNHDIDGDGIPQQLAEAIQAFHEYIPVRLNDPTRPDRIYRNLQYGDLVDIFMIDAESVRDLDTIPGIGELSVLGDAQWTWLSQGLAASTAKWRLIGNQKMMTRFSIAGLPSFIPFGDGPVADSGAWDGYNADRLRLLNHLTQNNLDNNIVLSGDIHMSFACDLAPDPGVYNAQTGAGSVAVEFLPSSVTRGNFDEMGFGGFVADLAKAAIDLANPYHVHSELESHGYGIVDIRADSAVAEFWYSDILQATSNEDFAVGYVIRDGDNHWDRDARNTPLVARREPVILDGIRISGPYPNPGNQQAELLIELKQSQQVKVSLLELASGRFLKDYPSQWLQAGRRHRFKVEATDLPSGIYGLVIEGTDFRTVRRWMVGR